MDMRSLIACVALIGSTAMAADVVNVRVRTLDGFGGDVGAVLSRCQTKVGQPYDAVTVSRDVSALNASGEFEEIKADAQEGAAGGIDVVFSVRRKLRYQAPLRVVGAQVLSESKIASESELKDGYLYGEGDLAAAAERVRKAYYKKHFPDIKVVPSVEMIGGNDCRVTLMVDEGRRMKIRDISFVGADGVEESEIRTAIGDYPWWNPVGWFMDSLSSDEQLQGCVPKIEEVFRDHGYLDVKVAAPERIPVEGDEEKCDVLFAVAKGECYRVGNVSIRGLKHYTEDIVKSKSDLPAAGSVAGAKALADAAHRIQVAVGSGDSGLADTQVDVKRIPSAVGADVLDLVFQVTEGVPVVIDSVVIRGNDYTQDKVIRREIELGPGDRMLADRAERSQRKLENLDYFSRVRYMLEPSSRGKNERGEEYRNLVYEVEEKNTGSFMVGVGASSVDSVFLSAEVNQPNFDLFAPGKFFRGAGQKARAYVQWGPRIQTIEASVTEPHLFGRLLELTVEGYRRGRWYDEYDLYRSGAAVTLSYPMKVWNPRRLWRPEADPFVPFGRFGARYTAEYVEFDDVDDHVWTYEGKPVSLRDEENEYGGKWESVVRLFWSRDTRDNFRMPTTGARTTLFGDISAGGEIEFWRLGFNHRRYFTTWKRFGHVFMVGLRAETVDAFSGDGLPIYERMFLGGPRSIRGVEYRNVAPFATRSYGDSVPWGGQTLFCMNFEYTVPIVKMLRAAIFSDLGSVGADTFDLDFAGTFAWTVGLGLRLDLPMFPIRLDFATPLKKPDEAEEEIFSFSVGYDF